MINHTTRRSFLKTAPIAAVTAAIPIAAASTSISALETPVMTSIPMAPSAALVEAENRLNAAVAELYAAKDKLQWIADEYRHLWPLAPEEILGGANGDTGYAAKKGERDILGGFIHRDTSGLTRRFNAKQRRAYPRACFCIDASPDLQRSLDGWKASTPKGRTPKALANNIIRRENAIRDLTRRIELAREYEATTSRLRKEAGVDRAKARIEMAINAVKIIQDHIAALPAASFGDLVIKARAISLNAPFKNEEIRSIGGYFGAMASFVMATVELSKIEQERMSA